MKKYAHWIGFLKDGTFIKRVKKKLVVIWREKGLIFAKGNEARELSRRYKAYKRIVKYKKIAECVKVSGEKKDLKIIWSLWLQGKENAPDIVQACFNSHKRLKGYKCIVLSEETINEYITLPVHIWEKYKKGIIGKAHFADIVRTVLLCEYGGIWCDSTCYYSGDGEMPGYIEDSELFLFSNKTNGIETSIISNWFIRAHSDSILLNAVKDMLFEYWRRHNKAVHYFFYHFLFKIATEVYPDEWRNVPYINNLNPHILQLEMNDRYDEMRYNYICSLGVFHKLTYIKDMQEGSFVDCIIRKEVGNARKQ